MRGVRKFDGKKLFDNESNVVNLVPIENISTYCALQKEVSFYHRLLSAPFRPLFDDYRPFGFLESAKLESKASISAINFDGPSGI